MKRTIEGGRAAWEMKVHAKYTSARRRNFPQMVFLRPLWIIWKDGRRFDIDRVVQVERAASRESGRRWSALYGDDRWKKTSSVL